MGLFHNPVATAIRGGFDDLIGTYRNLGTNSGYAGPIGLLGGRPDGESYWQWGLNAGTGGVQGILGRPLDKHIAAFLNY